MKELVKPFGSYTKHGPSVLSHSPQRIEAETAYGESLNRAWPLARRWQTQLHLLFMTSSLLRVVSPARTVVVRNWSLLSSARTLRAYDRSLHSHRRYHVMVPELKRLQLSAISVYLSKQGRQMRLRKLRLRPKRFSLGAVSNLLKRPRYKLNRPKKFRNTRAMNFRKNFIKLRRLYFERLKNSFFAGRIRPKAARRLLARFANKNNLALNLMFNLNPHKLVCRVFPFIDRFLLRHLIKRGELFVNARHLGPWFSTLKEGDIIRIARSRRFFATYATWVGTQQAYIAIMNKNLYQYYKARRQGVHTRRKQYLTKFTWYTGFYKAIPTWLEVSFLAMSFFIVRTPTKLAFTSSSFNPYLNRLLAFR